MRAVGIRQVDLPPAEPKDLSAAKPGTDEDEEDHARLLSPTLVGWLWGPHHYDESAGQEEKPRTSALARADLGSALRTA
jgi:hypothetical protein